MINYSVTENDTLAKQPFCYATAQSTETVDLAALAAHMSDHNTPFSKGAINGVLTDMLVCVVELIKEGKRVCLGDLGTFSAKVSSHSYRLDEKGNKIQITKAGDFTDAQVDGAKVVFTPGKGCDLKGVTFNKVLTRKANGEAMEAEYEKTPAAGGGGTSLS